MRKLLTLGVFLLAVPLGGQAPIQRWTWFPVNGGAIAYDDFSRVVDIGTGLTGINTVTYYAQPRPGPGGAYSFIAERLEFECRGNQYKWSKSAMLDRAGRPLLEREDGPWTEMGPALGAPALYRRLLCNAEDPPAGAGKTSDVVSLYQAMTGPLPSPPAPVAAPPAAVASSGPAAAPAPDLPKAAEPKAAAPKAEARAFDLNALAQSLRNEAPAQPAKAPAEPKLRP